MSNRRIPNLDELAYHARMVGIGTQPGEMFMIADETILSSEYEIIATQPMRLKNSSGVEADLVAAIMTFKGVINDDGRLKATSILILPEMIPSLIQNLRKIYTQIPLEYR